MSRHLAITVGTSSSRTLPTSPPTHRLKAATHEPAFQTLSTLLQPAFLAMLVVVKVWRRPRPLSYVFTAHGVGLSLQAIIQLTSLPELSLLLIPLNLCRGLNLPS